MRGKMKKWAAALIAAVLCTGMASVSAPMQVMAAEEAVSVSDDMIVLTTENVLNEVSPITVSTTQRCSIWSAPATTDENRTKYVDEGYQITVYPEVVASTLGDGKTFYRTVRGAYVLCRCVTEGEGSGSAAVGGSPAAADGSSTPTVVSAFAGTLPAFDNAAKVVTTTFKREGNGIWIKYGYDAAGKEIRLEYYEADKTTLFRIDTCEYDAAGRWKIQANYDPVDARVRAYGFFEYDRAGNEIKYTEIRETGIPKYILEYDAAGNPIKRTDYDENGRITCCTDKYDTHGYYLHTTFYNEDGTVEHSEVAERDAAGDLIKHTTYYADGSVKSFFERYAAGNTKQTEYRANGTVWYVIVRDAAGNETDTFYRANGTVSDVSEYDAARNLIKFTSYYENGAIYGVGGYDAAGNIKTTIYAADGSMIGIMDGKVVIGFDF